MSEGGYSYRDGFAISINYAIGTGAFALPFALVQAGSVLSMLCLSLFAVVSCICLSYVVESMARVGGLLAVNQSINQSASLEEISLEGSKPKSYGSINQSINQSTDQSINQSTNPAVNRLKKKSINQSINQSISHDDWTVIQLLVGNNQSINQPINQSTNQSINQSIVCY